MLALLLSSTTQAASPRDFVHVLTNVLFCANHGLQRPYLYLTLPDSREDNTLKLGTPVVHGAPNQQHVKEVVLQHQDMFLRCYEREPEHSIKLRGDIVVLLAIHKVGGVGCSTLGSFTLGGSALESA